MPRRNSEVISMSPRTSRPIVGSEPKNKQIALRATEATARIMKNQGSVPHKITEVFKIQYEQFSFPICKEPV